MAIAPDTLGRVAEEILDVPLKEAERKGLAELAGFLAADMAACRRMKVGEAEPALIYDPSEAQS